MFFTGNLLGERFAFVSLDIAEMFLERRVIFSGVVGTPDLSNQRRPIGMRNPILDQLHL